MKSHCLIKIADPLLDLQKILLILLIQNLSYFAKQENLFASFALNQKTVTVFVN